MAGFRNRLTHYYSDVTDAELFEILNHHVQDMKRVAIALRRAAERLAREGSA